MDINEIKIKLSLTELLTQCGIEPLRDLRQYCPRHNDKAPLTALRSTLRRTTLRRSAPLRSALLRSAPRRSALRRSALRAPS